MTRARRLGRGLTLRGLWERRWLSLVVLLVATMAAAAAAMGPTYARAARTEIVRDAFTEGPDEAKGILVQWRVEGRIVGEPVPQPHDLPDEVRDATGLPRAFHPTIRGTSIVGGQRDLHGQVRLIWRDGACGHLRFVAGRCPTGLGETVASKATSERYGWTVGAEVRLDELVPPTPPGEPVSDEHPFPLKIVGIYEPTDPHELYWFGRPYFPDTTGTAIEGRAENPLYDPLFIDEATVIWLAPAGPAWQWEDTLLVDTDQLEGDDARSLLPARKRIDDWAGGDVVVLTDVPEAASRALADQSAFGVPVTLVGLELVALCWLLLFLSISDLIQARARDIGLARLRGLSRPRVWLFGLAEPLVLLAVGLPLGLIASWPIATALSRFLLATDPPAAPGGLAWLAATGAMLGGVAAAALASRSTLTLPVTEHWRRSRSRIAARSWVPDAVVMTLVVAGLVELSTAGVVTNPSREDATSLLVPALLAIVAALAAARALSALCRRGFGITRRRGGLALFLALRQLGRAPGTAHTVIVLTTSFTLATFAVAAWAVTAHNHREVARTHNGAETVFVVRRPPAPDTLRGLVARADPGGRSAAAVSVNDKSARLLAVDVERLGHVAYSPPDLAPHSLGALLPQLRESLPPPMMLTGEVLRVTVDPKEVTDPDFVLSTDVELPERAGTARLAMFRPDPADPTVLTREMPRACWTSCELRGFAVETSLRADTRIVEQRLLIRQVEINSGGTWSTVAAGLTDSELWREEDPTSDVARTVVTPDGLEVTFISGDTATVVPATFPETLPALTVDRIAPQPRGRNVKGLDGDGVVVDAVANARAAPGVAGPAAIVDIEMAERSAAGESSQVEHQVWVAPGEGDRIREALEREGGEIVETRTVTDLNRRFNRQGPGLALVLLLASAGAAAVLAMARAVLGLYAAGRRRSYELAALSAVGVPLRTRRAALLVESAVMLGVGVATGVLAGVVAIRISLGKVPQFTFEPTTPPLTEAPEPLLVLAVAGAAALAVAVAVVLTTTAAIRRPSGVDQLREA